MSHVVLSVSKKMRQLLYPYDNFHSSGPYIRTRRGCSRMYINLISNDTNVGVVKSILYARYLLEVHLGRHLKPGYEVDHIDGFHWNDQISNLQELAKTANEIKGTSPLLAEIQHCKTYINIKCPVCNRWFEKKRSMCKGKFTFCSRHCAAKFYKNEIGSAIKSQERCEITLSGLHGNIPLPYYEPFEKYSSEYETVRYVRYCKTCGKELPSDSNINCPECVAKQRAERILEHENLRKQLVNEITALYKANGKVVMVRLAERMKRSDRGTVKLIERLYNKSYQEVINEICENII